MDPIIHREEKEVLHTFASCDDDFKYIYSFGLGVMALGSMPSIKELAVQFENIMISLKLPENKRKQVLSDINNSFERNITLVFKTLNSRAVQYSFIVDLLRLYVFAKWSKDYCRKIITGYMEVFRFSDKEKEFFHDFYRAFLLKNTQKCADIYYKFLKGSHYIRYDLLKTLFPDFEIEEEYSGLDIKAGDTVTLDKDVTVNGNVTVRRGGTLLIHGASLTLNTNVTVDGGRIDIADSVIRCGDNIMGPLFRFNDVAAVTVKNTDIDCHRTTGAIEQNSGRLIVKGSRFSSMDSRAVIFNGLSATIENTVFYNMWKGACLFTGNSIVNVNGCEFTECSSDYGGAIYSDSGGDCVITESVFSKCHASYLGACVYFEHLKLGQSVSDCRAFDCYPQKDMFFNTERLI
ncbi:MAG: right-handed parallel beta-helix repeat-containing protein [Lachnospiraceae bacterium]|jgi:hypothetical protein|nr:right-handed parallel beta-helix repeat-containing protein [Lachnospiraceae bacterium]MEE3461262.1 right-handed parallel beta-helix repeat-containing protein [Lachnospiraceae bacterium]